MADYAGSIKRPFSDIKKFIIGIIISIIPIINIFFLGYLINTAKSAMNRKMMLPEWSNWSNMFVKGILTIIITLIYMIPVWIVLGFAAFTKVIALSDTLQFTNEGMFGAGLNVVSVLSLLIGTAGITGILVVIVGIVFALLGSMAVLRYADTDNFGSAFDFRNVARKAFTGNFVGGWILTMIIVSLISLLLVWIPVVGALVSPFIIGVFMWTSLGQIYSEA